MSHGKIVTFYGYHACIIIWARKVNLCYVHIMTVLGNSICCECVRKKGNSYLN